MKTIGKIATGVGSRIFPHFAFTATPGSGRHSVTSHHSAWPLLACPILKGAWTAVSQADAQCEATASGQNAECYGNTPADDQDPWNTRSQQFSRRHF